MHPIPRRHPTFGEAALLITICFGWFIFSSLLAVAQDFPSSMSFSDSSLLSLVIVEIACGALVLAFLRYRGYALRKLLPTPTWRGSLEGVLVCGAGLVACSAVAMLLPAGDDATQPIARIVANAKPSLFMALAVSLMNGLYEETFLLGYLTRAFAALGASFALGLGVLVRLLYHLYQGPAGAVSVVVFGLVLGAVYWRTRRLWPAVVAHALADLLALS